MNKYIQLCILVLSFLLLHPSLYAQQKEEKPAYDALPFLVADDADTNKMNRYLSLGAQLFATNSALAQKYLDSALALGPNYSTSDQWLYAKIKRANWEILYGVKERWEELLKGVPALLEETSNPYLHGIYHIVLSEIDSRNSDHEQAIRNLEKALGYYENTNDHFHLGLVRLYLGQRLFSGRADAEGALKQYKEALRELEVIGEEQHINTCLKLMAILYNFTGKHEQAANTFYQVIKSAEASGDTKMLADAYFDLGNTYININDYKKAIECYHKSISNAQKIDDKRLVAYNYSLIGSTMLSQNRDMDSTIYYQEQALKFFKEAQFSSGIAGTSVSLAQSYTRQGNYQKAYDLMTEVFQTGIIYKIPSYLGPAYGIYADLLLDAEDVPEINNLPDRNTVINQYLDSCRQVEESMGNPSSLMRFWTRYTFAQEKMGDYKAAFEGYKIASKLQDSVTALDKKAEFIRLETEFKYAKQQDSLEYINQLEQEQLSYQRLLGKQHEQRLLLLNSESELRRVNLLRTETELNLQKEQGENLSKMLTIARQDQQLKQASLDEATKENELQRLRLRQQWILGLMILAVIGGVSGFLYYRYKNKQNRIKLELERQVSDAMLKSLHSQMNPHFIFNSLASVKSYISGNDPKKATNYLNNFAALIRRILHSSQEGMITFEEELETVKIYLSLEQERFKEKFAFHIAWDSKKEANDIMVPALFLQPYVENAVWHGIMHKKGAGQIDVRIFETTTHLAIEVKDNGAGLKEKALEQTGISKLGKRKSYGMSLSKQRLEQFWGPETTIELKSRTDSSGVIVTILIPLKSLKYATR